jgi:hypothetical protein
MHIQLIKNLPEVNSVVAAVERGEEDTLPGGVFDIR